MFFKASIVDLIINFKALLFFNLFFLFFELIKLTFGHSKHIIFDLLKDKADLFYKKNTWT